MNFEEELMDILEVDELKDTDTLEDFEDFDSLTILSIIGISNNGSPPNHVYFIELFLGILSTK